MDRNLGLEVGGVDLDGLGVVITGANRGLGRDVAIFFANAGARVTGCGRDEISLESLRQEVLALGLSIDVVPCDVTDEDSVRQLVDRAHSRWGTIDALVNNAAIDLPTTAAASNPEDWRKVLDVNVIGPLMCSRAVVEHMSENETPGSIINVSSVASLVGIPGLGPYAVSKAALNQLTRTLAAEWGPRGIRVNTIILGSMENVMEGNEAMYSDDSWRNDAIRATALGRLGQSTDLASCAAFLVSEASRFITGSMLLADGGYLTTRRSL